MNKLSLFKKLSLSALAIFLILVVGFLWVFQEIEEASRAQAEQELHSELAAHLVHDNPMLYSENLTNDNIGNLFHSMMILGANFEFYVLDNNGKILNYSAKPGEVIRQKINLDPVKSFIAKQQYPIYGEDPKSDSEKIFSTAIISDGNQNVGYLYVIVRSKIYDGIYARLKENQQLQTLVLITLLAIVFLLALIFLSLRYFVNPLRLLTENINRLQQNGFEEKLSFIDQPITGNEIGILTNAFNQMIEQINGQFEQLKMVDSERRELLTHLSHDLRTPLASLQGFLETIAIKHDTLAADKRQEYIQRSLNNAQRLKHFVDQIFELAHLESGHVSTTFETLPIAELLYDLKEKFSIKASNKNIELAVELDDAKIQITTDIGKLERVLSNLIENAIRHTPSGGLIKLKLARIDLAKQITIVVEDNGSGILDKEIPYLFDARYRGAKSKEDGDRHIGLGLTISRKLLAVLGTDIKVKNNAESGASFSFSLPVAPGY